MRNSLSAFVEISQQVSHTRAQRSKALAPLSVGLTAQLGGCFCLLLTGKRLFTINKFRLAEIYIYVRVYVAFVADKLIFGKVSNI